MESSSLLDGILLIFSLISLAVISSIIFKKLNFPYTIGLVVVGIIIGVLSLFHPGLVIFKDLQLNSELILYLILPVLIFDAALNIDSKILFRNIVPITALLAIGLLISAFVVGGLLSWTLGLSFGAMLLFGALISATDPIAVISLFKEVNAPKRLTTIIDGESMSNDATAIVLYGIVFALTYNVHAATATTVNIPEAVFRFLMVLFGGMAVGAVVGILGAYICKLDKGGREFQIILSVIMAYSAFLIADRIGFSGVMGSLTAGIVLSLKAEDVIKRKNREYTESAWEFFAYLANSFVFLLMGMTQAHVFKQSPIDKKSLIYIAVAIVVLLIARYISVIACNVPYNFFVRKKAPDLVIPHSYSLILTWGGLRGAIPAALALAIPVDYPLRDLIVQLTLACILFSLLVQGTTIKGFMNKLGIKPDTTEIDESVCIKNVYSFPNRGLIDLIVPKIVKNCEDEGFFVRERKFEEHEDYLMRMHQHTFLFRATNENIQVIAERKDMGYASTVMHETIVELKQALGSIAALVKQDKFNHIILDDVDLADKADFDFMEYLSPESIIVPLLSTAKKDVIYDLVSMIAPFYSTVRRDVIQELVDILEKQGKISNSKEVCDAVFEREKAMSTGLGNGVAIPRAKTSAVEKITVAIGISQNGIEFETIDKKPIHIVALILSPEKDSTPYLKYLSEMGKVLSKENIREKLVNARTPQGVYRILSEMQKALG